MLSQIEFPGKQTLAFRLVLRKFVVCRWLFEARPMEGKGRGQDKAGEQLDQNHGKKALALGWHLELSQDG